MMDAPARDTVSTRLGSTSVTLLRGDITSEQTDAIVNAANSDLMGGGGVDGAIHRAGGTRILEECKAIRAARGPLPTGKAVITTGGRLSARYVIHTVGPVWQGGTHGEDALLADAYRNSLLLALENNLRSIAFPCISTGIYGFPIERAAKIAFRTIADVVRSHSGIKEVRLVTFRREDFDTYAAILPGHP